MYCKKCGGQMDDTAVICPSCGAPTENYVAPKSKGSTPRLVIGIISIVLFVLVMLQSCAVGIGNTLADSGENSGSAGFLLAICFLVAGIVGVATRRGKGGGIVSGCFYAFGGVIGIANVGSYSDLKIWSILSIVFAVVFIVSSIMTGRDANNSEKD